MFASRGAHIAVLIPRARRHPPQDSNKIYTPPSARHPVRAEFLAPSSAKKKNLTSFLFASEAHAPRATAPVTSRHEVCASTARPVNYDMPVPTEVTHPPQRTALIREKHGSLSTSCSGRAGWNLILERWQKTFSSPPKAVQFFSS